MTNRIAEPANLERRISSRLGMHAGVQYELLAAAEYRRLSWDVPAEKSANLREKESVDATRIHHSISAVVSLFALTMFVATTVWAVYEVIGLFGTLSCRDLIHSIVGFRI